MLLMTTFVRQAKAVVIWQYGLSSFQERDTKLSKNQNAQRKSLYFVNRHSAELSEKGKNMTFKVGF